MSDASIYSIVKNETQMIHFGEALADACKGGEIIFLHGELGTGKTTLVRGFMRKLGYKGAVKSPTYTLVEQYDSQDNTIYHFDLYRLANAEELEYMGIRDYFNGSAICLIEWPQQGRGYLPEADVDISIAYSEEGGRQVETQSVSERGVSVCEKLHGLYSASL